MPPTVKTKVPKTLSYIESIAPTFKCPHCGCSMHEKYGQLAHTEPLELPYLACIYCIKDFHLIVLPDASSKSFE